MKKNAVLVDFKLADNWDFIEIVERKTQMQWETLCLQSNQNHGGVLQQLIRYAKYFIFPMKLFFNREKYANILAWQQFYGLILAFYFRIFKVKNTPTIIVMTFIYKEKKSLLGKLYYRFIHYILHSGYIRKILVFSEREIGYYAKLFGVQQTLFTSIELGVEDEMERFVDSIESGDYYVSAGRSNRDYQFLMNVWIQRREQLKIICDSLEWNGQNNLVVMNECFGDDYLKELAGCKAVIIPVQDEKVSSGQLVALHAMMFGKPIIATKNEALQQYIVPGETGYVIEKSQSGLNFALSDLENLNTYKLMSENARKRFQEKYTFVRMAETIGELLSKLCM